MPSAPCYNCPKRYRCCHSNCKSYAEYRADIDRIAEARAKDQMITSASIHHYAINRGHFLRIEDKHDASIC